MKKVTKISIASALVLIILFLMAEIFYLKRKNSSLTNSLDYYDSIIKGTTNNNESGQPSVEYQALKIKVTEDKLNDCQSKISEKEQELQKKVVECNDYRWNYFDSEIEAALSDIKYKNSEYGFEFTLPKGWEKYKFYIEKGSHVGSFYGHILLPTSDQSWSDNIPGYANMMSFNIYKKDAYKQICESECCKNESCSGSNISPLDCIGCEKISKENNKFIFGLMEGSRAAVPEDLININLLYKPFERAFDSGFNIFDMK